jgi:hypothetical protein
VTVGGSAGTFAVRVLDAGSQGVAGIAVSFAATPSGSATFSPATATTDETGTARTSVTLGTVAGTATLTASATGVTTKATASVLSTAGAATRLVNNPRTIRLFAIGDTARITGALQDQYANTVAGTITYSSADASLVTVDGSGLVRVVRVGGAANVIASGAGRADTTLVTVLGAGASPCVGVASPTALAVGATMTLTGASVCLGGSAAASEFAVIAYNSSTDGNRPISTTATALGIGTAPAPSLIPSTGALAMRAGSGASVSRAPVPDEAFHLRMMNESRSLRPMFGSARVTRQARLSGRTSQRGGLRPSASYSMIPSTVTVGQSVTLNVNANVGCSSPDNRGFVVKAVGTKSVVLADTLNPANGFSDADYARFAARFDTLVYPMDVGYFGAPSDLDNNGKVAILFTKAVNELTQANSTSYVGGFFYPRDLFPKVTANGLEGCAGSNEGEMFYMLVPDPAGAVNGNRRTVGFVDSLTTSVIAHEFQHLINAGRRLYVNTAAEDFETSWLNEGLSHIAEELLYYRESGMQPRQHLGDTEIRLNSNNTYPIWKTDAASNFRRLIEYLEDPGAGSPVADDDELSTRGATWAFLRFAVDRQFTSDAAVWLRFGNSITTGVGSLNFALQTDPAPLLADFAIANYVADLGINADPRFIHKSWNFRDIFATTFINLGYPLKTSPMIEGSPNSLQIRGSSASYLRLSVPASKDALLSFSSGQGAPNNQLKFTVVRTK